MARGPAKPCDPLWCGPACMQCEEERLRYKLHVAIQGPDLVSAVIDAQRRAREERHRADSLDARLRATMLQLDHLDRVRSEQGDKIRAMQRELDCAKAHAAEYKGLCTACGQRIRDVVLACGHLTLCKQCVGAMKAARAAKCPECGENFGRLLRVAWT